MTISSDRILTAFNSDILIMSTVVTRWTCKAISNAWSYRAARNIIQPDWLIDFTYTLLEIENDIIIMKHPLISCHAYIILCITIDLDILSVKIIGFVDHAQRENSNKQIFSCIFFTCSHLRAVIVCPICLLLLN